LRLSDLNKETTYLLT